jgi:hypothetical protein
MGDLFFCQFGGRRGNMYSLSVDHYRSHLRCKDIELKGSYVGLISMHLVSIEMCIEARLCYIAEAPTVQALSF